MDACREGLFLLAVLFCACQCSAGSSMKPMVILYETGQSTTDEITASHFNFFVQQLNGVADLEIAGKGEAYYGWGGKMVAVLEKLRNMENAERIVVISDARDVLLNGVSGLATASMVGGRLKEALTSVTGGQDGVIVASAERQCCVAAMTHARPGDYFASETGGVMSRDKRACRSGDRGCVHKGPKHHQSWRDAMKELADQRGFPDHEDIYLNAGLLAGRAKDLVRVIEALDLEPGEDDQAVMTDLMLAKPDLIMLDYGQQLFGNNNWEAGEDSGCVYDFNADAGQHEHEILQTRPLFLHFSNAFFGCYDRLGRRLGYRPRGGQLTRRRLNYGTDAPTQSPTYVFMKCNLIRVKSWCTRRSYCQWSKPNKRFGRHCSWVTPPTDAPTTPTPEPTIAPTDSPTTPTSSPTYQFMKCDKIRYKSWCTRRHYCQWSKPKIRFGRHCGWVTPQTEAPTAPTATPTSVPTEPPTLPTDSPTYTFMDCMKIRARNLCSKRHYCQWAKPNKRYGRHCSWVTPPTKTPTVPTAAPTNVPTMPPTAPTGSPTYVLMNCNSIRVRGWCKRRDYCKWTKNHKRRGRYCRDV